MSWFHAVRARLRLLAPRAAESRIDDEIRFHIDMETQRLVRDEKLSHDEAKRRALVTFGGVQQHRETLREGRGTAWLSGLSLDLKLGFRMLVKYPGLTVVGVLAMAFGIWFGAVMFQMFGIVSGTTLPLPGGERIVKVLNWDLKQGQDDERALFDYQLWRTARSFTDMGAYTNTSVNLVGADGSAQPVAAAEVTAAAFRIAPERPLLGRVLRESDEAAGAPPVLLLGHKVWTERFDSDPRIVGRSVQTGSNFATVVGVMPKGYAFPVAHNLWRPLRTDVAGVEPRRGMAITVFGRLAEGATFETAQAELRSFGKRLAAEHPATHAQLQPHVIPYAKPDLNSGDVPLVRALSYFFTIVLVTVVCSTVALLLFARAASRESEILVRSALGASRGRIVAQLFAEALVLAGVAVVLGLGAAQLALTQLAEPYLKIGMEFEQLPFWYDLTLSPITIAWALTLAVIGAVVAGVMPARKITSGLGTRLRAGTAGGGVVSFGGVWTAVIVTQVALTVLFPAVVMLVRGESNRVSSRDLGFRTQEYLGVSLAIESPSAEASTPETRAALATRFSGSVEALRRRLEGEPGVAGVTFVDRLPGDYHINRDVEVASLPEKPSYSVETARIDPSYFSVLKVPVEGRAFSNGDRSPDARVVIVDRGFVDLVMAGRNPVGHHVRIRPSATADSNPAQWPMYEIIGVVKELGMSHLAQRDRPAGVYLPFVPGSQGAINMMVHGRGDPLSIATRVRELATGVDATIRIESMTRLDQMVTPFLWFLGLWIKIITGLTVVALVLSLAGIYAVLSFTVARRTREIGVRMALGASARRVITSIFRRPLIQVSLGVFTGIGLIGLASIGVQNSTEFKGSETGVISLGDVGLLFGYAILMLGVCMLACVVPTIRALRVQPTEALRSE
jgi:putative ABC transport system permease protein